MIPHSLSQIRRESARRRVIAVGASLALLAATGCSSGVAPSKTAGGAGTGAMIGGAAGAVAGNNSSMGTGTGLAAGAALGAITGGIIGMVQDAKDRREQDRLAQERAYQQELAKKRAEEAKMRASMEEELAIAEGFRISDLELNDAKKKQESTSERLKRLQEERSGALAKKKALDEAHEKTLSMEAEIARIEEELARLKGDEGQRKPTEPSTPASKPSQQ
ncbi:MAG: hypothetical protein Q8N18_19245 [Opitutaceae bacterium]|nr:hypothetical protein [Opitutaceae bacterium]